MFLKQESLFPFICAICGKNANLEEIILGAGVFISKDDKKYIVTASHVVMSPINPSYIKTIDSNGNTMVVNLVQSNNIVGWKIHSEADIAVFEISFENNEQQFAFCFFPFDYCDINEQFLNRNTELTAFGFPFQIGANIVFSPITFRSYPSSGLIRKARADRQIESLFFLLEHSSIRGYSGGPLFAFVCDDESPSEQELGKVLLQGIMHGFLGNANDGGEMAMVTPITYLNDLI